VNHTSSAPALVNAELSRIPATRPLLVMDMYEHAYHMDYGAAAAKYLDAFMQNVNWEEVNRRYVSAQKAAAALKA
jgi:superoxide dismutase, Fe-Mn family